MSISKELCLERVRTPFCPRAHGFPFPNSFPPGRPTLIVDLGVMKLKIGDARKGLCGGMIFAAEDYRRCNRPVPNSLEDTGVYDYVCRRLRASFNLPSGVAKLYAWMAKPDRDIPSLTVLREWPAVRTRIRDRGEPATLMLVKVQSWNPFRLGENHQALAYGYDRDPRSGEVALYIYDPNYPLLRPEDEEVTLHFNERGSEGRRVIHSREGAAVLGFFVNTYRPVNKLPG